MTKQQIIDAVLEWAEKLGHAPSHVELMKHAGINRKIVRKLFGNYGALLAECKLAGTGSGYETALEDLFRDWAKLVRELKKLPTISEYDLRSQYSVRPLTTRFGTWKHVPHGLKQYVEEQGWTEEWKDVLEIVQKHEEQVRAVKAMKSGLESENIRRARRFAARHGQEIGPGDIKKPVREVYGGRMTWGPMVCAPTNEQGVILLFGAMAEKLGFGVLKIGMEYPDCEAFMQIEEGRWVRMKIEFEFESRNFLKHMHDRSACDIIVCWKHNWQDCPLEVIELSTAMERS